MATRFQCETGTTRLTTPTGAAEMCFALVPAFVMSSFPVFPGYGAMMISPQSIYQLAYEAARETVRRQQAFRLAAPSLN